MVEAPARECFEFQADAARLLQLMVHSLYTHKDVFLRELISNASDALDRVRFEGILHPDWLDGAPLEIRLDVDEHARTLTIRDNGIGMRRQEVVEYLGTIARSMTHAVALDARPDTAQSPQPTLIGQFGVGFYSAFMVADHVVVVTRHPDEPTGVRWECSAGSVSYALESAGQVERGTAVTLFLKSPSPENGLEDYADRWVLTRLVKQHSDFIAYPITLHIARSSPSADDDTDALLAGKPLNSMKPIWTRPPSEIADAEYDEFYKHVSHDWRNPLLRVACRAEGRFEYHALVFVPVEAPPDLYYHGSTSGLQLYAQRVLVMERCTDLLPRYLRFVRGVVDSADLPLHISRQTLQEHQHIAQIRKWLTRKILDTLTHLRESDGPTYLTFWKQFGRALKEGVTDDFDNRDRLLHMLLFESSQAPESLTTLSEYTGRMKPEQEAIYYLTGASRSVIEHSPQLEAFRERGYEVLYLTDPVDELFVQCVSEYEGKRLRSVLKGVPRFGNEEAHERELELQRLTEQFAPLHEALQRALASHVRSVRVSRRLVTAPVCLVCDEADESPRLEQLLLRGKGGGPRQRRVLEINPDHPMIQRLLERCRDGQMSSIEHAAPLLHGLALLAEGSELIDPVTFTRALTDVMTSYVQETAPAKAGGM